MLHMFLNSILILVFISTTLYYIPFIVNFVHLFIVNPIESEVFLFYR